MIIEEEQERPEKRARSCVLLPLAPSHSAKDSRPAFATALSLSRRVGNSFGIGYGAGGR